MQELVARYVEHEGGDAETDEFGDDQHYNRQLLALGEQIDPEEIQRQQDDERNKCGNVGEVSARCKTLFLLRSRPRKRASVERTSRKLGSHPAAIHVERLPSDEGGVVAGQE